MNNTYYQEKLESLPENLRYAVVMSDWEKSLLQIRDRFKLHVDQTQVLEDSAMKLMFGDIDAPDFINVMFNEAHINSETAADILLEVDLKILKNIRERMEAVGVEDQKSDEIEALLLDDEEVEAREEADAHADYYEDMAKMIEEEPEPENLEEIPTDINKEKDDLLAEINSPTKSFTNIITPEPNLIPVDHQIENIHIEEPYHQVEIKKVETIPDVQPQPPKAEIPTELLPTPPEPKTEIKKPININLNDIYREPIE